MPSRTRVLERGPVLDELTGWSASGGLLVLVSGEAGIGKTTLVEALADRVAERGVRLWRGHCDPLTTPRPLGPLVDMAAGGAAPLRRLLDPGLAPNEVLTGVLDALRETPALVVVEDVHWADAATLDLLRFLGRRAATTRALVVATYRDDEVGHDNPLGVLLGELLRQPAVRRVELEPLSAAAVEALAGEAGVAPAGLHRLTGGNPFFVTEVLQGGGSSATVREAVLARLAGLDDDARSVVRCVATDPRALELRYAAALTGAPLGAVDRALDAGTLVSDGLMLRFRHELARRVVWEATPSGLRAALHRRLVQVLEEGRSRDLSRLAHHAVWSADPDAVLRHAPTAGREAVARGAHREAAALFAAALRWSELLDPRAAAELRLEQAEVLTLLDRPHEALEEARAAVAVADQEGDTLLAGHAAVLLARALWLTGRVAEANRTLAGAVEVLGAAGPSLWLVEALVAAARDAMLGRHHETAVDRAHQARDVAEKVGADTWVTSAEVMRGTAEIVTGDPDTGIALLLPLAEKALQAGDPVGASSVFGLLGSGGGEVRRYDEAWSWLSRSTELAVAVDLDYTVAYNTAWQARIRFEQGRWSEATALAQRSAGVTGAAVISPVTALSVLGRTRVRRGDPRAREPLDDALRLGASAELQHRWPALCGMAELCCWEGDPEAARALLAPAYREALATDSPWARGELGYWLWRAGGLAEPDRAAEPFLLMMRGQWQEAAVLWERLGCPYEQALALAEGHADAQSAAVLLLDGLGAGPAGRWVRGRLRAAGHAVPRGPRRSTRARVDGLTDRQAEVRDLVLCGLTNSQIAARLYLAPKTVEHHVSAVLEKVGARSRAELVALSRHGGEGRPT